MATTSIWSVKGWLGKVVIYIENPDKTENPDFVKTQELTEKDSQGLSDVIAYAVDCEKTKRWIAGDDSSLDDENEIVMKQYVSGINCTSSTARTEMMAVKKRYGKDEGIMAFHGYQTFAQQRFNFGYWVMSFQKNADQRGIVNLKVQSMVFMQERTFCIRME